MCFSLGWLAQLLVWAVVIGAVYAIITLLLPRVMGPLGEAGALVMQILRIVLWAAVLIFIIYFAFDMISCLVGGGFPHLRVR